jgi:SWI/SNF-related matrix-associated actin-dependent regulator 1 of chromatin subfamily A
MPTKLLPYQADGVRLLNKFRGRALLADEMGLGKTIQVLRFMEQHPNLRPAVIVVPAFLKWEWQEQAVEHCNLPTSICEGQKAPKKHEDMFKKDIYIISYGVLHFWTRHLKHQNPKLLVFDECHYIKNNSTKRTKAVERMAKICEYVIAVGGTPLLAKPSELFTTLRILWPERFGDWYKFGFRYCDMKMNPFGGWDSGGASHLPELRAKLHRYGMIRRTKD